MFMSKQQSTYNIPEIINTKLQKYSVAGDGTQALSKQLGRQGFRGIRIFISFVWMGGQMDIIYQNMKELC